VFIKSSPIGEKRASASSPELTPLPASFPAAAFVTFVKGEKRGHSSRGRGQHSYLCRRRKHTYNWVVPERLFDLV